jgi:hypothetical protein
VLRAGRSEADEIDDCIRLERCDPRAERPRGVLGCAVDVDALYCVPCRMWYIRLPLSTAGDDYFVPGGDEPWNQERADVAGTADDDDSNGRLGWSRCLGLSRRNLCGYRPHGHEGMY